MPNIYTRHYLRQLFVSLLDESSNWTLLGPYFNANSILNCVFISILAKNSNILLFEDLVGVWALRLKTVARWKKRAKDTKCAWRCAV